MKNLTAIIKQIVDKIQNRNSLRLFLLYVIIMEAITFFKQKFIVVPNILEIFKTDENVLEAMQISNSYIILPYIASIAIITIQILVVSFCLYVGGILSGSLFKLKFSDYLSVSVFAQIIFVLFDILLCIIDCTSGVAGSNEVFQAISLLKFFDFNDSISPLFLIPFTKVNIVVAIYCFLLSLIIWAKTGNRYNKCLLFVVVTYGVPFILLLLSIFLFAIYTQ